MHQKSVRPERHHSTPEMHQGKETLEMYPQPIINLEMRQRSATPEMHPKQTLTPAMHSAPEIHPGPVLMRRAKLQAWGNPL